MRLHVVAVGKIRGPLADPAHAYLKRCGFYWDVRVSEVPDGSGGAVDAATVKATEAARIRKLTSADAWTLALTRNGPLMDSRAFALLLNEHRNRATREVEFWIGGAFGLDDPLLQNANQHLSLSTMTLPHDLARVLLLEQVYRAGTILRGEPYHKGQG